MRAARRRRAVFTLTITRHGHRHSCLYRPCTAHLDDAVTAFRDALKEYTRERVPLAWAAIQNNLGLALATLGEREGNSSRYAEAATAFEGALSVYRDAKLDWKLKPIEERLKNARTKADALKQVKGPG